MYTVVELQPVEIRVEYSDINVGRLPNILTELDRNIIHKYVVKEFKIPLENGVRWYEIVIIL